MHHDQIIQMISGFQSSRILLTSIELKIFTHIADKHLSVKELSHIVASDESSTEILLNALTSLGFLRKNDNKFSNTTHSMQFLSESSPDFIGGAFHSGNLWNTWSNLSKIIKKGKGKSKKNVNQHSAEWLENFIAAMHSRAKKSAVSELELIDFSTIHSMLDLGGGSGIYGMSALKINPSLQLTLFDLPAVIPISLKYIRAEGFEGKIKILEGDFDIDDIGCDYDLVFLSAIIHMNDSKKNLQLIRKCAAALNEGGKILIQDFVLNEDKTGPARAALFAVNMLVGTKGGTCYTLSEITEWFEKSGIVFSRKIDLPSGAQQIIGIRKKTGI